MLTELHIESLGVIDGIDLVLGPGLTALTGETGAGKTMLVEAISLLVGGRADGVLVRPGATEARVEGRFVIGDDELVLARVIPADGRSRAYVNGRLATATTLADEGARLVDLHGQHSHQSLLGANAQRRALDRFAGVDLEPLRSARARVTEIDAVLATLGGDERSRARELDLVRFQVDELDRVAVVGSDEDDVLADEEAVLADATAHREAAARALAALQDESAAADTLGTAIAALHGRRPFTALEARLRAVAGDLADVAVELRSAAEGIEEDPERLAALTERRHLLREMRRKYGDTLADVIGYHAELRERLAELEGFDARAAALDAERGAALAATRVAEAAVGTARRAAAPRLGEEVAAHLRELAMPKAMVEVRVGADPGDDVTFLLGANPGEPMLPLAKVASGGELARAMLALRLVLTEAPDTLVFDEVDAGIGGSAAVAVGRALSRLGERHQVLVVTHLPQVAALATTQVVVSKGERSGRTVAAADRVDGDARVAEIARMLAGDTASEAARRHAEELLRGR